MMKRFLSSLVLVLLVSAGCTNEENLGGRDGGPAGTANPSDLLAACASYRTAWTVDRKARCLDVDEIGDGFDEFCARALSAPGTNVDVTQVTTCADKLRVLACDQSDDEIPECVAVFGGRSKGTLPDGSPCALDSQCASGACPGGGLDPDDFKCGTCRPPAAVGASCDSDRCVPDAICTSRNDVAVCEAYADDGESCADGNVCRRESSCDQSTKTCKKDPGEGGSCGTNGLSTNCAASLNCIDNVCSMPRAAGEACSETDNCVRGLFCDTASKVCTERTVVSVGDACGSPETEKCEAGAYCEGGKCTRFLAPGAVCTKGGVACAIYYYCGPASTCDPLDPGVCNK